MVTYFYIGFFFGNFYIKNRRKNIPFKDPSLPNFPIGRFMIQKPAPIHKNLKNYPKLGI